MAEVTIVIKGRQYDIACDDGQEDRVLKLASYIDNKIKLIARSGSAYNESHLMVLTSLVLADEVFETKEELENVEVSVSNPVEGQEDVISQDDSEILEAINSMAERLDSLSSKLREAS